MITISNVTKKIKGITVLSDVTMQICSGEIACLTGPNGSGKTMLLRTVAGLLKPDHGTVTVNEHNPYTAIERKAQSYPVIGLLIENPAFLDGYTGLKNLSMLASIRSIVDADALKKVLELVGLDPEDKRKYRKYSLGMKQRLGIALAIMEKPDVLILDEPTNALDESGVRMVQNLLADAANRGATVLIASHDDRLIKIAHNRYILAEGHIDSCAT